MIKKKKSKIHRFGIFAKKQINKNTKIVQYTGEKITARESEKRTARYARKGELWTFELNTRWHIDAAVGGGIAKYANHSDKPNCWIDIKNGEIWYRAARQINSQEEITVNYGTHLPE